MKKRFLTLFGAFMLFLFASTFKVSAADMDFADIQTDLMGGQEIKITSDDTLTFSGETWIGEDGRITLNSGDVVLKLENGTVNITVNGEASVNALKQFIMQIDTGSAKLPIKLIIPTDSTVNIDGTLAIPTGTNGVLENEGTVNINGNMEIRSAGVYSSTGVTNLYGNLAIYGEVTNNLGNSKINLFDKGNIYSASDASTNIVIGEKDTNEYVWEVVTNDKKYTSVTSGLDENFDFGYVLSKKVIQSNVPDDTEKVDEEENPKTSDNIIIYACLLSLSLVGVISAVCFRKKLN